VRRINERKMKDTVITGPLTRNHRERSTKLHEKTPRAIREVRVISWIVLLSILRLGITQAGNLRVVPQTNSLRYIINHEETSQHACA
jgi:hypothetical protein